MYKNQLQELAQRSCFNLPSYTCIREGPDHAPRFKAIVNFNGDSFQSHHYFSTLRQAEHAAAEVALISLSSCAPSHSLAARILDETGVYKNLLQEISQRVGAPLPHYMTYRSSSGHQPVFTGKVELAGITFTGEPAKNKKHAEKNAALAAWQSLKLLAEQSSTSSSEQENNDELEQVTIARALLNYRLKEKMANPSNTPLSFPQTLRIQNPKPSSPQHSAVTTSKILPLIFPKKTPSRVRPTSSSKVPDVTSYQSQIPESRGTRPQKLFGVGAPSYTPIQHGPAPCHGLAPPITIRSAVPCYSAPPVPPSSASVPPMMRAGPPARMAPPVCIRQSVPVFSAPPIPKEDPLRIATVPEPNKASDEVTTVHKSTAKEAQDTENSEPAVAPIRLPTVCSSMMSVPPAQITPPVCLRQAPPARREDLQPLTETIFICVVPKKDPILSTQLSRPNEQAATEKIAQDSEAVEKLEQLKL